MLVVRAEDHGKPVLSSTVTVIMNIRDVNDNAPVFDPSSYSDEVAENATIGTSILTVTSTDIDTGILCLPFGCIIFFLSSIYAHIT